jgi:hypothetical protein
MHVQFQRIHPDRPLDANAQNGVQISDKVNELHGHHNTGTDDLLGMNGNRMYRGAVRLQRDRELLQLCPLNQYRIHNAESSLAFPATSHTEYV